MKREELLAALEEAFQRQTPISVRWQARGAQRQSMVVGVVVGISGDLVLLNTTPTAQTAVRLDTIVTASDARGEPSGDALRQALELLRGFSLYSLVVQDGRQQEAFYCWNDKRLALLSRLAKEGR